MTMNERVVAQKNSDIHVALDEVNENRMDKEIINLEDIDDDVLEARMKLATRLREEQQREAAFQLFADLEAKCEAIHFADVVAKCEAINREMAKKAEEENKEHEEMAKKAKEEKKEHKKLAKKAEEEKEEHKRLAKKAEEEEEEHELKKRRKDIEDQFKVLFEVRSKLLQEIVKKVEEENKEREEMAKKAKEEEKEREFKKRFGLSNGLEEVGSSDGPTSIGNIGFDVTSSPH